MGPFCALSQSLGFFISFRDSGREMLIHHFGAETQGFQGLLDQNDLGKMILSEEKKTFFGRSAQRTHVVSCTSYMNHFCFPQGGFLTGPPLNMPVSDLKKTSRVPDWPPLGIENA